MVSFSKGIAFGLVLALCETLGTSDPAASADLAPTYAQPPAIDKWQFSLTPYGWATSINGDITARGHKVDVNESFIEIVEKSDSLLAWMSYFEARKGRFAFFTDCGPILAFPGTSTSPEIRSAGSTERA